MRIPASTVRLLADGRLARSARTAADRASRHDPAFYTRDCDDRRATLRLELAADVFGVSPWEVTVTDDHVRDSGGIRWFRVVITDHDENEYRFTTCATVTTLRILGRARTAAVTCRSPRAPNSPPSAATDPGHAKKCPRP
jgi:hypothetical protein